MLFFIISVMNFTLSIIFAILKDEKTGWIVSALGWMCAAICEGQLLGWL